MSSAIFQSTLPVRGATISTPPRPMVWKKFQSTLPVRGATVGRTFPTKEAAISIHAPREGSDYYALDIAGYQGDFNPRSP